MRWLADTTVYFLSQFLCHLLKDVWEENYKYSDYKILFLFTRQYIRAARCFHLDKQY